MWAKLAGKKTYIVAGVSVAWAVVGAIVGLLEPVEALNIALAAMGAAGQRNAV